MLLLVWLCDFHTGRVLSFPNDCRFSVRESEKGSVDVLMTGSENRLVGSFDVSGFSAFRFSCMEEAVRSVNEHIDRWVSEHDSAVCFLPSDVFGRLDWDVMISEVQGRSLDASFTKEHGLGV